MSIAWVTNGRRSPGPCVQVKPATISFGQNLRNEDLEREMFSLQPGEVSRIIGVPEGYVVFRCEARTPANAAVNYEALKPELIKEVTAKKIQADVDTLMEEERAFAEASPMPDPADAGTDVYFDNATEIPLKYGDVRVQNANASAKLAAVQIPIK